MIKKMALVFFFLTFAIYFYIFSLNELTKFRLKVPELQKKVHELEAENIRLQFEVDQFESPIHLMELIRKPEFSHLHYPYSNEIIQITTSNEQK